VLLFCPHCASLVSPEWQDCRYCNVDLQPLGVTSAEAEPSMTHEKLRGRARAQLYAPDALGRGTLVALAIAVPILLFASVFWLTARDGGPWLAVAGSESKRLAPPGTHDRDRETVPPPDEVSGPTRVAPATPRTRVREGAPAQPVGVAPAQAAPPPAPPPAQRVPPVDVPPAQPRTSIPPEPIAPTETPPPTSAPASPTPPATLPPPAPTHAPPALPPADPPPARTDDPIEMSP
jgi:hypothetical protein